MLRRSSHGIQLGATGANADSTSVQCLCCLLSLGFGPWAQPWWYSIVQICIRGIWNAKFNNRKTSMQSSLRFPLCDFGTLGHKDVILIILGEVTMRAAIDGAASLSSGFGFEFFSLGFGLRSHWTMRYFGGGLATGILSDIGRGVQCFLRFFCTFALASIRRGGLCHLCFGFCCGWSLAMVRPPAPQHPMRRRQHLGYP